MLVVIVDRYDSSLSRFINIYHWLDIGILLYQWRLFYQYLLHRDSYHLLLIDFERFCYICNFLKCSIYYWQVQPSGRRLLGTTEVDSDSFPTWLTGSDRKLLAAKRGGVRVKPNVVVAKDGSGQYKTIGAALAAYPKALKGRYVIYVKAGVYNEPIIVTKDMKNIFMYGDGPRKTIVTGRKSNRDGITTQNTASFGKSSQKSRGWVI